MRLKTEAEMRAVRAAGVKESSVETHFLRRARTYGCKQRKLMGGMYGSEGWPDRVLVWPDGKGTTDWVELKRPKGGKFEPKQLQIQGELRGCGSNVETLYTRTQVDDYFERRSAKLGVWKKKPGSKRGLSVLKKLQTHSI